ncbi:MAG: exonuclease [Acidimicrobiaceae bacterium]|jgi:genome maintenance exonuclease 1|nr:exonuclease [Acidimicrobiaceae bacterium]|tara:strand:+ start:2352 stop:2996 length:645 start_codon:yes stop_codon:yes gene_type:complete
MFDHVELEFEELKSKTTNGARVYETPDGSFPSITTVLGRKKAQFFKEWRARIGEEEANKITTQATRRGTKVHKVVENYIDNKENYFEDSQPNVRAMFNSIKPFLDNNLSNIAGIEIPLWSKQLGVAGRCDCVADWKGQKAIIDWKTSGKPKKKEWVEEYFLQATAYSIMFEERTEIPINNIVIVIGVENEEPQIFEEKSFNYWKTLETTLQEWL